MIKLPLVDRVKFFVERQFVKGAGFQLLLVAALIGLISLAGGAALLLAGGEATLPEAIWWAFLRLTDPGYLGDDVGGWRRFVSTLLTISGYVVFLGALVAIMTQWLIARMREFERGLTPVSLSNHVVIVGWTNRTLPLLRELVGSEHTARRFLRLFEARRLTPVVLSEDVSALHAQELRADPVIGAGAGRVILRYGSALEEEAIQRAACLNAAVVLLPSDFGHRVEGLDPDVETIRALLSMDARAAATGTRAPRVVAEVQDARRMDMVRRAYAGPLEIVASDRTISRLMMQTLIHPGLSRFLREALSSLEGNEFHLRPAGKLAGAPLKDVAARCPKARVLGLIRAGEDEPKVLLNAPTDTVLRADDRVVLLCADPADAEFERADARRVPVIDRAARTPAARAPVDDHRLLVLGWNDRVPELLVTLAQRPGSHWSVDLMSFVPLAERQRVLSARGIAEAAGERLALNLLDGDYLNEGVLDALPLERYRSIVLLTSDRLASSEEADARAIVGHRMLEGALENRAHRPHVLIELADAVNEGLVRGAEAETLIPPLLMSHVLAQLALRPELGVVFDELFAPIGAEVAFRAPRTYRIRKPMNFDDMDRAVAAHGDLLLGVQRRAADGAITLDLNPPRERSYTAEEVHALCVLTGDGT
ncbi:ion channel DMI1 [Wenzhouxiangella sp. XN79A]|uniref:CASTOR/POLLUX-related putative ion channel n=1 Tax=Wenzhouxiangella sp. XN79A TaxID=2724193 RepID=UPI00144ABF6F|nr:ion channel DMI1 [Wenzhouxiangella sp. XN79A]NKI35882.1 ion channel DMI1 [Wenzhouxiangella sp. XN79A]